MQQPLYPVQTRSRRKKDVEKANDLAKKACDASEARGCVRLGFLYKNGKGVEQDDAKASKFYEKACDAGEL